jgi:hypothetical protein
MSLNARWLDNHFPRQNFIDQPFIAMPHSRAILSALLASVCAIRTVPAAHAQTVITQWNFTAPVSAPDNSPAPTFGNGTATMLGMTNSYTYTNATGNLATEGVGSVASGDILSTPGVANTSEVEDLWRIRGAKGTGDTGSANNGWNLSAPEYSQGVEFDVSTLGFQNISVSFDWYSTTQGVRTLQEQYTLNGSTWLNINAPLEAVSNDYFGTTSPTNTINFSSITGANDDAEFGIRLVSAYDPAFGNTTYSSAASSNTTQTIYNNNSGNWRFGNITVAGSAISVPEPATSALFTGAFALLLGFFAAYRRKPGAVQSETPAQGS